MSTVKISLRNALCLFLVLSFAHCSGGGGGGDGGGSNSGQSTGPLKRTSKTGIRVIHGALDSTPVSIRLADQVVQSAHYGEATRFTEVSDGPVVINVEHANAPADVISQIPMTLEKDTEYNIFLSGMSGKDSFSVQVLPEAIVRPEKGFGRIRLAHSLDGAGALSLADGASASALVARNSLGDYIDVASGAQTVQVLDKNGGTVAQLSVTVPDQGDLTVLISGSRDYAVQFATVYEDLD